MALITEQISARNFELIRDKIGTILTLELASQTLASGFTVWNERKIPFTPAELNAINVSFSDTNFDNANVSFKRGTNIYNIDVHVSAPSTVTKTGDILASEKAQRIAGVCDYILSHPIYQTLGFEAGFIANTFVESITISDINSQDSRHNIVCRLSFKVVAGEDTLQLQPVTAEGYDTQVKLELTDFGHKYTLNN